MPFFHVTAVKSQKRILIVQDISCMGRCSMQVALPVLSAAGLHCAMLPTAILSTHTGGFGQVHRRDMREDMAAILRHWQRLGQRFDAMYIGYLGDASQAEMMLAALPRLTAPGARLFVDPVMADHGKPYTFCGPEMVAAFRALCQEADVIFPNRTEAALLLAMPLNPGTQPDAPDAQAILSLGAPQVVLSGVESKLGQIGLTAFEAGSEPRTLLRQRFPGHFPGTGDMLASAVIAGLMTEKDLVAACAIALDFIGEAFKAAAAWPQPERYGLPFERALPGLIRALGL